MTTSGLPSGEQTTVVLHGAGIRREIEVGRRLTVKLPTGRYSLDARRVIMARAHRGVQQGAVAYPAKKKIPVVVEQGASIKLVVRYAVVNAGVRPLPKRVLGFKGDPSDPTVVLLPGHAGLPRPGTIFVSGPTPALPRGLISKVTAVHEHLGKVVASLVAVPVSDAIPSLDFVGNLSLTAINGGAAEAQSDRRSSFTTRRRQVAPSVAHQSSGCRPPSLVKFGAHLDSVELRQASIGAWPPQMRLTLAVRSTESLGVAAAAVGVNCDWTLAELGPYQAAIPVGPIVIPVYATLPVNAGIHINGRLDVGTVNIASTTVATTAAGVDETKASLSQQGSNVWMSGSPSISGSAKLSASIGVQAGIGVAKGANVHLEADFGPEFDWSSGHGCDLLLNLGSLSAGVTVLGRDLSTPSFTPLHPQIWSGCQSASGGGGSTPGAGGGGGVSGPSGGGETPGGGEEAPRGSGEYRVMIATLSGGTWSAVPVSRSMEGPEEAAGAHDPACTASGICVVASGYYVSGTPHGWLNTYTAGGGWTTEEAPLPVGGPPEVGEELGEPACAANPVCVVPGSYHQGYGMIETLTGGHWSAVTAPIPSSGLANGGVVDFWSPACSSTGICVVTGEFVDSGLQEHDMIETLSGGTWTSTEAPVPSGGVTGLARLQGNVACGSGESCFIPGSYEGSDGETHGMLESLKAGTWTSIQVPIPAGAVPGSGTVDQPACSWSGLCVTLGGYRAAGEEEGMIDRFISGAWSSADLALPEDGVAGSGRRGAPTCSATGTCAIAGEYQPEAGGYPAAMIDIVTDSSSTVIGLPSGGYGWPSSGVSEPACVSADSCVVVSDRHNFNDLVLSWIESSSGGAWSSIEPPVPPGGLAGSGGISGNPACSSEGTCVLPGGYDGPGGGGGMTAVRSAAGNWTAVPAPTPPGGLKGSGSFELHNRPACSSAGLCVLVGGYQVSSGGGAG